MNESGSQNTYAELTPVKSLYNIAEDRLNVPSLFDSEDTFEWNGDQSLNFGRSSSNNNLTVPIAFEQFESQNGQEAHWEEIIDEGTVPADESNGAFDPPRQNITLTIPTMKFNTTDGSFVNSQVTIESPQGYRKRPVQRDDHSKNFGHLNTELKIINEKIDLNLSSRQECAENLEIFGSELLNQNRYELTFEKEKGNRGRDRLYGEPTKTAESTDIKCQSKKEREAINQRNKKYRSDNITAEKLKAKNESFDAYESEHNSACEFLRHHLENRGELCIRFQAVIRQAERFVNSIPTVDVKQFWTQNHTTQKRMDEGLKSYTTMEAVHSATRRCRCVLYDENLVELASFYKTLANYLISWKKLTRLCIYDEEENLEPGAKRRRIYSEPPLPAPNRPETSQDDLQQEEMVQKVLSGELDCSVNGFFKL